MQPVDYVIDLDIGLLVTGVNAGHEFGTICSAMTGLHVPSSVCFLVTFVGFVKPALPVGWDLSSMSRTEYTICNTCATAPSRDRTHVEAYAVACHSLSGYG